MKQTKIETEVAWTRVRASKAPYGDIDGAVPCCAARGTSRIGGAVRIFQTSFLYH